MKNIKRYLVIVFSLLIVQVATTELNKDIAWAGELYAGSNNLPIRTYTNILPTGKFVFELWISGHDESKYNLMIQSFPVDINQLISITDEANAFSNFLNSLIDEGIDISNIECLYIPFTNEKEVQERLINETFKYVNLPKKNHVGLNKIVSEILLKANVYKEISDVLYKHKLKIAEFNVEKILTKKMKYREQSSEKKDIPCCMTVFIMLQPMDEDVLQNIKIKRKTEVKKP